MIHIGLWMFGRDSIGSLISRLSQTLYGTFLLILILLLQFSLTPVLTLRSFWHRSKERSQRINCSKSCPNSGPKQDSQINRKLTILGPQNGPQNVSRRRSRATAISGRGFPKSSCFQEGPRWAQDGPEEPKIAS